jgi:hypothetical protein
MATCTAKKDYVKLERKFFFVGFDIDMTRRRMIDCCLHTWRAILTAHYATYEPDSWRKAFGLRNKCFHRWVNLYLFYNISLNLMKIHFYSSRQALEFRGALADKKYGMKSRPFIISKNLRTFRNLQRTWNLSTKRTAFLNINLARQKSHSIRSSDVKIAKSSQGSAHHQPQLRWVWMQ